MADKSISELVAASAVGSTDLFVLEQTGTAKKLTGQILENWLVSFADGHGGIQSIVKTSTTGTDPVIDTYTITLADTTTSTFTVTNGLKGDTGAQTYVWLKYAANGSPSDAQISDSPNDYIGIYVGLSSTAPTTASSYTWYKWKGEQGDIGDPAELDEDATKVEYTQSDSGSVIPSSGWSETVPTPTQGRYLWTRTTVVFNSGDPIVYYSVSRYGIDGSGSVSTVNNVSPDLSGNVSLTGSDLPVNGVPADKLIVIPASTIPIPASGSSASYNLPGLTADHVVVRWGFSSSSENLPPCDLVITTNLGYFTVSNTNGTTSESISPVFAVPTAVAVTTH